MVFDSPARNGVRRQSCTPCERMGGSQASRTAASSSEVKNLYRVRIIIARIFWYALMFVCTLADVDTVGECCTEQHKKLMSI